MRFKGKTLKGPKRETLVIPRESTYDSDGVETINDIVFFAEAVLDFDEFEMVCPVPVPPTMIRPGGLQSPNPEDPNYKKAVRDWSEKKRDWMILKSLAISPEIEWEQVNLSDPETYALYKIELVDAGFNQAEINLIVGLAFRVNSVDEDKMEEARNRFLASQVVRPQS